MSQPNTHQPETTTPVCICGHPEGQHFEDVCQTCGCGDYLEPSDAAEVIARWRQAALKGRDGERAAVLREAADIAESLRQFEPTYSVARSAAQVSENVGILRVAEHLRRLADEAQPDAPSAEDPARIDRLRPEFTEHASVEAIDAQIRRARSQERRWHLRTEWLIGLRQAKARQDGARRCPAKHGALGRICELPYGHDGMHTGSGSNGGAVWDGDAS